MGSQGCRRPRRDAVISLLIINYRSAELAIEAITGARAASAEPLHVVVVDNSCDAREAEALRRWADVLLVAERNLGYAGGVNRGRAACSGDVVVVANPDVRFSPESLDLLVAELRGDVAVAGPALFWDDGHRWILPPNDRLTTAQKLDEVLASRSRLWFEARDRRRIRQRLEFWSRSVSFPARALSGAVLAIRLDAFDAVGGFDERFALYFEETDFLRRMAGSGYQARHVPAARVRHLFNQSAGQESERTAILYAQSEMFYLEKWSGRLGRALKRLEKAMVVPAPETVSRSVDVPHGNVVVEASPLPSFVTAAGHFPTARSVEIPPEVRASLHGAPLYVRVIDRASGDVLAQHQMDPERGDVHHRDAEDTE